MKIIASPNALKMAKELSPREKKILNNAFRKLQLTNQESFSRSDFLKTDLDKDLYIYKTNELRLYILNDQNSDSAVIVDIVRQKDMSNRALSNRYQNINRNKTKKLRA